MSLNPWFFSYLKIPNPIQKTGTWKTTIPFARYLSSAYELGVTWILESLARTSLWRLQLRSVSVLFLSLKDALPEQKQQ